MPYAARGTQRTLIFIVKLLDDSSRLLASILIHRYRRDFYHSNN
jgi:hypothetical protein